MHENSKGMFRLSLRSKSKQEGKSTTKNDSLKPSSVQSDISQVNSKSSATEKRKNSMRSVLDEFEAEHSELFCHPRKSKPKKWSSEEAEKQSDDTDNDPEERPSFGLDRWGSKNRELRSEEENCPAPMLQEGRTRRRMSLTGQHTLEMVRKQSVALRTSAMFKETCESDMESSRNLEDMIAKYEDLFQSNEEK